MSRTYRKQKSERKNSFTKKKEVVKTKKRKTNFKELTNKDNYDEE
jgi:hypothetical protein